jgi:hypothetical protein
VEMSTIEKAILILAETQRAMILTNRIAIFMLCVQLVATLVAVYLAYSVKNDTIYIKRKMDDRR